MNLSLASARTGLFALSVGLLMFGSSMPANAQTTPLPPLSIHYIDDILAGGNLALATSLITPSASLVTPEGDFLGPAGVGEFTSLLDDSFSNLDFQITGTEADEDDLRITFTMTGIQSGNYQGVQGRCAQIDVAGEATLDIEHGLVQGQVIDYDQAEIVRQAARYNQLAIAEGITCSQGVSTGGIDTVIRTDDGQDEILVFAPAADEPASRCQDVDTCALP